MTFLFATFSFFALLLSTVSSPWWAPGFFKILREFTFGSTYEVVGEINKRTKTKLYTFYQFKITKGLFRIQKARMAFLTENLHGDRPGRRPGRRHSKSKLNNEDIWQIYTYWIEDGEGVPSYAYDALQAWEIKQRRLKESDKALEVLICDEDENVDFQENNTSGDSGHNHHFNELDQLFLERGVQSQYSNSNSAFDKATQQVRIERKTFSKKEIADLNEGSKEKIATQK